MKSAAATAKPSSAAVVETVQADADTGAGHEPKPAALPERDLAATQPPVQLVASPGVDGVAPAQTATAGVGQAHAGVDAVCGSRRT